MLRNQTLGTTRPLPHKSLYSYRIRSQSVITVKSSESYEDRAKRLRALFTWMIVGNQ
jgi:hypothetical protein